jgi:cyclic pyranopterin phosphate synthase
MRSGASNDDIIAQIKGVWRIRRDRYSQERGKHPTLNGKRIEMSYIGG